MNENKEVPKSRNGPADLLKGIAVLLMIQVHIMEQLAVPDLYNSILGKISLFSGGPACAPVFMAVMGYFLASTKKSFYGFFQRGLLLIAGGILLNTGRSANLLIRIFSGSSDLNPWTFILGADIFTLAGLSVIAVGLLRFVFKNNYLPYLFAAITVAVISPFLSGNASSIAVTSYLTAFFWGNAGWSYFPVFPWTAYVLAGYAYRLFLQNVNWIHRLNVKELVYYAIPFWLILILTMPWASGITSVLAGPGGYYHHGILFFGWTILFMAAYLLIIIPADEILGSHWLAQGIKWIGARVTVIYVIQWLIIGNIATVLYRSQDLPRLAAWFPVITTVSCFAALLYLRIRKPASHIF
ncbi:MAG: DUF1624 domain-containing protein [Bacteroidetes bacterium]|nr:MAG: DUF1624 domain-containing protein [Bacteroidota bacterium]